MNRRCLIISIVLLLWVIILSGNSNLVFKDTVNEVYQINDRSIVGQTYTPHAAIIIDDDTDFASQGWSGSGIIGDPYIITGYSFDESLTACILVRDTTVYFEIKDCLFEHISMHPKGTGVLLDNVVNGKIMDCYFEECDAAILIGDSRNCIVKENTVIRSWGISIQNSNNCTLNDNSVSQNDYGPAFGLYDSYDCTIAFNNINLNSQGGMRLANATLCIVTNNMVNENEWFGFSIQRSANCTISLNSAMENTGSGLSLYQSTNCTVSNNTAYFNSFNGINLQATTHSTVIYNCVGNNTYFSIELVSDTEYNRVYLNRIDLSVEGTAEDNGHSNYWDDGVSRGNFWKDYKGQGDYHIPGNGLGLDHYPFVWDPVTTTTDSPDNEILTSVIVLVVGVGITAIVVVVIIILRKRSIP